MVLIFAKSRSQIISTVINKLDEGNRFTLHFAGKFNLIFKTIIKASIIDDQASTHFLKNKQFGPELSIRNAVIYKPQPRSNTNKTPLFHAPRTKPSRIVTFDRDCTADSSPKIAEWNLEENYCSYTGRGASGRHR